MLLCCWSAKGGAGTTVVSSALALVLARDRGGALLVDLAGDCPAALGCPDPTAGISEWLAAGERATHDALGRLEVAVTDRLSVLPLGAASALPWAPGPTGEQVAGAAEALRSALRTRAGDARPVVVDCGTLSGDGLPVALARSGQPSLLVTRPCYLALRRAMAAPVRADGVIVVHESGRALGPGEVEDVLGIEVLASVDADPGVARAVDAGLLATRLPRSLSRSLAAIGERMGTGARP